MGGNFGKQDVSGGFVPPSPHKPHVQIQIPPTPTFGKFPVEITCPNCRQIGSTRVAASVNQAGWAWAIICCCLGSWLLSPIVNCVDCFRKWTHSCPACNVIVGVHEPPATTGTVILLTLSSILVMALVVFVVYVRMISM